MTDVIDFKCPNCGGSIEFNSNSGEMKCPFCDSEFDIEAVKDYTDTVNGQKADETEWKTDGFGEWSDDGFAVYTCNNCGGELVTDSVTAATSCPFCNSSVVLSGRVSGQLKPDYIIPFKLDKNAAKARFSDYLKGKRLLPKVFKSEAKINDIKGVYVPFWLFDTSVDADIRYRATRVRVWSDSDYNYTETSYFAITRQGTVSFAHVPVDGSTKAADDLTESLEPFDFSEAVDFNTAYLAGYLADKYDVDADTGKLRANDRIKHSTEDVFRSTVHGYNTVVPEHSSLRYFDNSVKYAMYPVWLMTAEWKGKSFTFAMNGQTGKFVGNLPTDRAAFWRWFGVIAAISSAMAFGLIYLIGGWCGFI